VRYLRVEPNGALSTYDGERPFRAIVVVEDVVAPEWQAAASRWLVDAGCLYMLAWGRDCSSWDDSVDLANLQAFDFGEIPDEAFVTTTWHDDEPLSDVFEFAKRFALPASDEVNIVETIIFHVSRIDRSKEYGEVFAAA
jgi:hypothetical protein